MYVFLITLTLFIICCLIKKCLLFLVLFYIIWILFLNVNTYSIYANKFNILEKIPPKYLPAQMMLTDYKQVKKYPIIIKPIICSKDGKGILVIKSQSELELFIKNNALLVSEYMIQDLVQDDVEIGVLVEKYPFQKYVKIIAIVEKKEKIMVRVQCKNDMCVPRNELIPFLEKQIKDISYNIPNFNVGRYDIKTTEDKIRKGEFKILEVNGTLGFDLRKPTYISFIYHAIRWFLKRLQVGLINILSLNGYDPHTLVYVMAKTVINTYKCKDWEKLLSIYT